jgi:protein-L-isoaspartate(D-aspartate) O-methyltransferase
MKNERYDMVSQQLVSRGIQDERVLAAFRTVPREAFVPEEHRHRSYADHPVPIGEGQTISQPYVVALMLSEAELEPQDRALDIGTGSGYAAAVLSRMVAEVYTVERHARLADRASQVLSRLGYDNIHVRCCDGSLGWPQHAPYDSILAGASAPRVSEPLLRLLRVGGRLVLPVGPEQGRQNLVKIRRRSRDSFEQVPLGDVSFVPLIGAEGWDI